MFGIEQIVAALLPAASDGVKTVINHFFGDKGNPQTVADVIKLNDSEIQRLKTIAELDKPTGTVHTWVNDIRALQRPFAVAVILSLFAFHPDSDLCARLAGDAFFYLFGDRGYMYLKQMGRK